MKREEHDKLIQSIQEKLGVENSGLIADDLGLLITDNNSMNEIISHKEIEIQKLKSDKETLITTNGNLLKQVGMGIEIDEIYEEPKKKEPFNMKSVFDENGNFIS